MICLPQRRTITSSTSATGSIVSSTSDTSSTSSQTISTASQTVSTASTASQTVSQAMSTTSTAISSTMGSTTLDQRVDILNSSSQKSTPNIFTFYYSENGSRKSSTL